MDAIIQWATILSPIIAVGMAWWTIRSSAKDTAKQIESIKELSRIQIETSIIQLEKELSDARTKYLQMSEKNQNVINNSFLSYLGAPFDVQMKRMHEEREKSNDLSLEEKFYENQINCINNNLKKLEQIKQQIN